jgi:hypothetical protein
MAWVRGFFARLGGKPDFVVKGPDGYSFRLVSEGRLARILYEDGAGKADLEGEWLDDPFGFWSYGLCVSRNPNKRVGDPAREALIYERLSKAFSARGWQVERSDQP